MTENPAPQQASVARRLLLSPYLGLALCLLLASPLFFLRGIGVFDDSMYLKFGEMIADGALPYRDFMENKPPGIYYVAALIALLGRGHWLAPRLFLFAFAALFGGCVVAFSRSHLGERAARWAGWLFGLSYVLAQGYSLHTEQFCGFFGFLAALAVTGRRRESLPAWFGAGLLIGVAFLFKQPAVFYVPALIACQLGLVAGRLLTWRPFLARAALLLAGFVAPLGLAACAAFQMGVIGDAYGAIVIDGVRRATITFRPRMAADVWLTVPAVSLSVVSVVFLAVSRDLRQGWRNDRRYPDLLLWASAGVWPLLATLPNGWPQGHYAGPAVWGLVLANVAIWSRLSPLAAARPHARWRARLRSVFLVALLVPYGAAVLWGGVVVMREDRLRLDLAQWGEIRQVLAERVPPDCPILCVSSYPGPRLYYMSGRRPAVRYLHHWWTREDVFSRSDAWNLVATGAVPAAIVEMPERDGPPGAIGEQDLSRLGAAYEVVRLRNGFHPLYETQTVILLRTASDRGADASGGWLASCPGRGERH